MLAIGAGLGARPTFVNNSTKLLSFWGSTYDHSIPVVLEMETIKHSIVKISVMGVKIIFSVCGLGEKWMLF